MKAPFSMAEGQSTVCTVTGKDNKQQPYTAFTVQQPPLISDPSVLSYDLETGQITALAGAGGSTATLTWTGVDNIDTSKTASKVDEISVTEATSSLESIDTDYADPNPHPEFHPGQRRGRG